MLQRIWNHISSSLVWSAVVAGIILMAIGGTLAYVNRTCGGDGQGSLRGNPSATPLELPTTELPTSTVAWTVTPVPTPMATSEPSPGFNAKSEEYYLNEGETREFFNGLLSVSLVRVNLEGDPLAYRVYAVIGSPGGRDVEITGQTVGSSTPYYINDEMLEIRITLVDPFSAMFRVTRMAR